MHYALTFRLSQLLLHPLALNELIVCISLISTDYLCILYFNIHNIIHNYPIMVRFGLDLGWIIGWILVGFGLDCGFAVRLGCMILTGQCGLEIDKNGKDQSFPRSKL